MSDIFLTSKIGLNEIVAWRFDEETSFLITRAASFEPGVQGIALSLLRTVAQGATRIKLVCEFDEPLADDELSSSIFGTPFGFSLARLASYISFGRERSSASEGFKSRLGALYMRAAGAFGTGREQSLVCGQIQQALAEKQMPEPSTHEKSTG